MPNQVSEKKSFDSQNWRELSPEDAKKQRYIRVGFAALAVVIALAVAGSCYYLATHNSAPLCAIPVIFGGIAFVSTVIEVIVVGAATEALARGFGSKKRKKEQTKTVN